MKKYILIAFMLAAIATKTYAVRPFITDDGVVTGRRLAQWEGWAYFNRFSGEQWNQVTFGITERWEVAVGGVWGYYRPQPGQPEFSYATPMFETKYLFYEYHPGKRPGVALAIGTALLSGKGAFVQPGRGAYSYLAVTHVFDDNENFTVHGNIGLNYLHVNRESRYASYWGVGGQVRAFKGLHVIGEVISSDPYDPDMGLAFQTGFRYFVSNLIQVDVEIGRGLSGKERMPFWVGCGARFVITKFEKKQKKA